MITSKLNLAVSNTHTVITSNSFSFSRGADKKWIAPTRLYLGMVSPKYFVGNRVRGRLLKPFAFVSLYFVSTIDGWKTFSLYIINYMYILTVECIDVLQLIFILCTIPSYFFIACRCLVQRVTTAVVYHFILWCVTLSKWRWLIHYIQILTWNVTFFLLYPAFAEGCQELIYTCRWENTFKTNDLNSCHNVTEVGWNAWLEVML